MSNARLVLEAGKKQDIETERKDWRGAALSFWAKRGDAGEGDTKKKKPARIKSYTWLCAVEHQLRICTGIDGRMTFQIIDEAGSPLPRCPSRWPGLTINLDQGSDGWAALNFANNALHLNILGLKDPAHRCWNDCCQAMKVSGVWPLILAFIVIASCDHGPWQDARWCTGSVEAARTYEQIVGAGSCPIFEQLFPKICRDKGLASEGASEELKADIFGDIRAAFAKKPPKVASSRWFAVCDALAEMDEFWHSRLTILLCISINEGWMRGTNEKLFKMSEVLGGVASNADEGGRQATGKDSDDVRQLKKHCANNLRFCCEVLLESDYQSLLRGSCGLLDLVRADHGVRLQENRSCGAGLEYYILQASGACMQPLREVLSLLEDHMFWDKVGVWCDGPLPPVACGLEARTCNDNELVSKLGDFALSLVGIRFREVFYHTRGWPGSFPAILNPEVGDMALKRLRQDLDLYERMVRPKVGAFWNQLNKRTSFNLMCVRQAGFGSRAPALQRFRVARSLFCRSFAFQAESCRSVSGGVSLGP